VTERKGISLTDVAGAGAFVVGILMAWLYVAGWMYAYTYFDLFRVTLLMTELPREHYFVYGGLTLWKSLTWSAVAAVGLAALVALAVSFGDRIGRAGLVAGALVVLVVLFLLARLAGMQGAYSDFATQRSTDYRAYPRVVATLKPSGRPGSTVASAGIAASGCARLVLSTKERLFLIRPRKDAPALELHTHILPWDIVGSLIVTDKYESCP